MSIPNSELSTSAGSRFGELGSKTVTVTETHSRPQWKVVYRTLRLISDWALSGFFSEVCIEGAENVPSQGPLILTPCHHNELIDIATLAATIPHRRMIAYWTKSSVFKSSIARKILNSAGALPVSRAPQSSESQERGSLASETRNARKTENGIPSSNSTTPKLKHGSNGQQELFDATYKELAKRGGGVLGVFPEGTSYTLPHIAQVKEGVARATLGYVRWLQDRSGGIRKITSVALQIPISVVPVGIIYTDKSSYRSRLYVRYGTPIDLRPFVDRCVVESNGNKDVGYQAAVHGLTKTIEKEMVALTINAPDWDTLYASQTARAILWADERTLRLKDFVKVSKILVDAFARPEIVSKDLKNSLLRYNALLYYTGFAHSELIHVPLPASPLKLGHFSMGQDQSVLSNLAITKLIAGLPSLMIPPLYSFATHLAHTPAYLFGAFASHAFAGKDEESRAQHKVIFGGLGRVLGTLTTSLVLVRSVSGKQSAGMVARSTIKVARLTTEMIGNVLSAVLPATGWEFVEESVERCMPLAEASLNIARSSWSKIGGIGDMVAVVGVAWLLCAWHARVIDSNYTRYKQARATLSVLRAVIFARRESETKEDELKSYLVTPPPPVNPYIAKSVKSTPEVNIKIPQQARGVDGDGEHSIPSEDRKKARRRLSKSVLVRHLLLARADAVAKLQSFFRDFEERRTTFQFENGVSNGVDLLPFENGFANSKEQRKATAVDVDYLRRCGAMI